MTNTFAVRVSIHKNSDVFTFFLHTSSPGVAADKRKHKIQFIDLYVFHGIPYNIEHKAVNPMASIEKKLKVYFSHENSIIF